MGLEVREVGPIETPRHRDTVYMPATTVPPTVVAPCPKRAETVARAQSFLMVIGPGLHQSMKIIPSLHIKSAEAIITRRGGVTVQRATRCTRRVPPGQPSHAAHSGPRQPGTPAEPACRGGVGQGRFSAAFGQGAGNALVIPALASPSPPPPVSASPGASSSRAAAPSRHGGPVVLQMRCALTST